jgi:hypothetical protein
VTASSHRTRCTDRLNPPIFFSILQRKVVTPNDFTDLIVMEKRLTDFEDRYNQTARPFRWKFTTTDLNDYSNTTTKPNPEQPNHRRTYKPDH